jgi:hypothetical protein
MLYSSPGESGRRSEIKFWRNRPAGNRVIIG